MCRTVRSTSTLAPSLQPLARSAPVLLNLAQRPHRRLVWCLMLAAAFSYSYDDDSMHVTVVAILYTCSRYVGRCS